MRAVLSPFDTKRLHSYSQGLIDYHVIVDLLPACKAALFFVRILLSLTIPYFDCLFSLVARLWLSGKMPGQQLSALQKAILVGIGFQHKTIDELATEFDGVAVSQVMALFGQIVRKLSKVLRDLETQHASELLGDSGSFAAVGAGARPWFALFSRFFFFFFFLLLPLGSETKFIGGTGLEPIAEQLAEAQGAAGKQAAAKLARDARVFAADPTNEYALDSVAPSLDAALATRTKIPSSISLPRPEGAASEGKRKKDSSDKGDKKKHKHKH
jgi:hypothetical protein